MLRDIVRFEWRYHTRQISFAAASALFLGFGFMLTSTGFGPDNVHVDSPYSIAQSVAFLSLLSVFVLAVFCANAVVRDRETQMEEIVFSTSVEKLPFLLGRFTGSFLAAFTAFSFSVAGMFAARFAPWQEPARVGEATLIPYVWVLLVVALPNLLFAGALLFALSTITRSVLASYAGSVLVYVLYFVAAALTNSPLMAASAPGASKGTSLAAVLDPFALTAFFEQTQHWLPAERNTRLLQLSGTFLANRLVWIAASAAVLAATYRLFSFRTRATKRASTPTAEPAPGIVTSAYTPVTPHESQWRAYVSATKLEVRSFLGNRAFAGITLLWIGLAAFELISEITGGEYGSALYPASGLIFGTLRQPLSLIGTILLIYTSAEIVWRERALRIAGILHATPASNAVFVLSKVTTLTLIVVALTASGLVTGAAIQLARGWSVEPARLLYFGYFLAAPLVAFAIAAIVIQTLSPQKYFGMLLVLLLAVIAHQGASFGLEHPLWRFGATPPMTWSDLSGFADAPAFHLLMLFQEGLAALLLLIAALSWRSNRAPLPAIVTVGLFLIAGRLVFGELRTSSDVFDWRAGYEKRYQSWAAAPQPRIASIRGTMDLEPGRRRYRVRGEYVLVNDTSRNIDRILVAVRRDADRADIAIRGAQATVDEDFRQYAFTLDEPLAPGDEAFATFDITYATPRFTAGDPDYSVLENGSYIMSFRAFPSIGYRRGYEIANPTERRRRGLAARASAQETEEAPWVSLDLTVTTAADQTVVAPGRLVADQRTSDRRLFRFRTDAPIPNQFIVASARYDVTRRTEDGVAIEVYSHPSHRFNVERVMQASAESLRLFRQSFGPYPHAHFRVAEAPAHWNFGGFAQPGAIFLGENRGMLIDSRDPRRLDLVYRRVAHEVAHQWWGHGVVAMNGPGASTIVESLTKYAELIALERARGREEVGQSLAHELDIYLKARTDAEGAEPTLMRTDDEAFLYYRKGAIVMYAIRDLIGERAMNGALASFFREQSGPGRRPTTAQLLAHLKRPANAEQQTLIEQWMNDVVPYDLGMESARVSKREDGRFAVSMRVRASKTRQNGESLPFDESIDVGVFAVDGSPLSVSKQRLRAGVQEIVAVVDKQPLSAAVDPYVLRVDRNRFDNTRRVE